MHELDRPSVPKVGSVGDKEQVPIPGLLYADDLLICSLSIKGLQIALNKLSNFCETADLIVHTGKTKVICFKKGPTLAKDEKWTFNGQNLETVRSVVYLGMSISMSGKWTQHIKKSQIKGRKAAAAASCILYKCLDPPIDLCHKLYVSHVESAALYGAEIWGVNNIEIMSSPERHQRKGVDLAQRARNRHARESPIQGSVRRHESSLQRDCAPRRAGGLDFRLLARAP